jgi:hypothetical protein
MLPDNQSLRDELREIKALNTSVGSWIFRNDDNAVCCATKQTNEYTSSNELQNAIGNDIDTRNGVGGRKVKVDGARDATAGQRSRAARHVAQLNVLARYSTCGVDHSNF